MYVSVYVSMCVCTASSCPSLLVVGWPSQPVAGGPCQPVAGRDTHQLAGWASLPQTSWHNQPVARWHSQLLAGWPCLPLAAGRGSPNQLAGWPYQPLDGWPDACESAPQGCCTRLSSVSPSAVQTRDSHESAGHAGKSRGQHCATSRWRRIASRRENMFVQRKGNE